jgi:S-DNA-T family DNA segregation ATPase FtsK/SpoIIIE
MLENQANQAEQASKPVVAVKNVAESDEYFVLALKIVVENRQASASLLQRRLRLGWNRAGSLIDAMQKMNYISAPENNKRQVLLTMEQFREIYGDVEEE